MSETGHPFTGRTRKRVSTWRVRAADRAAKGLILAGGLGTIASVFTVALFLLWVVLPLFRGAELKDRVDVPATGPAGEVVRFVVDEYRIAGWTLDAEGTLRVIQLDDGSVMDERPVVEGATPTATGFSPGSDAVAFGFADGTIRVGRIGFATAFLDDSAVPPELRGLKEGEIGRSGATLVQRTPEGQLRSQRIDVQLGEPLAVTPDTPIVLVDHLDAGREQVTVTLSTDGRLSHAQSRTKRNLLTGEETVRTTVSPLPFEPRPGVEPFRLLVTGLGDNVLVAWRDGLVRRIETREPSSARLIEEVDLVPGSDARLTAVSLMLGRSTLIVGDSEGRLTAWFRVPAEPGEAVTEDGFALLPTHELLLPSGVAITSIGSSARSRIVAVGDAAGTVRLLHVTSERQIARAETADAPVLAASIAPKDDGLAAFSAAGAWTWGVDLRYPEAGLHALFRPVWYEGYSKPEYVWQSSSGTDDFEMKLGLVPLIFGTIKATVYSMLFGAPIAILAAVYTSEFLTPRVKAKVKPTIELMASLPSVVLGFLAALVVAPFIESVVPATLTMLFTVPAMLLLGAHLWQLVPHPWTVRMARYRMLGILVALPLGVLSGVWLGPVAEAAFFDGNFKLWADGQVGDGSGGWLLLFLPLAALLMALGAGRWLAPWVRELARLSSRGRLAVIQLAKLAGMAIAAFVLAWGISQLLTALGLDPRGTFVGTYVQRNAMVVGAIMGFAIIPIIYTISEDALSSVPEHLRSASLGAGATPWQTAVRIIIPTAMSGLFSALMIGLGRAVGETMIVLMAAGNTPVMELNVFNGFRTLSANIAVELPEAVRNSTHYRTLFLAALTLFAMTFVVNTVAEVVRMHFRKRAIQL